MKRTFVRLGLAALLLSALAGCGGGGGDAAAPSPTVTPAESVGVSVGSNASTPSAAAIATWKALEPQIEVSSVTIASPPVVKFTVKDATGTAVVGLGNKSQSATATVASYTNIAFTLAKLVPGSPSKWVSYNVIKPPTVAQAAGTLGTSDSCSADRKWCGTYPTTDREGTLVDHGDGSYTYTFLRDPKAVASIVASLPDSSDGLSKKADLGDLTFASGATHRLGIQIGGAAPGTGSNTPTATASTIAAVNMVNTANLVYEFRPDGNVVTNTRSVVNIDSCGSCHDGKVLAHGSRKDPNYCVTCHTDQIRYSFSMEAPSTNNGLTLTGTKRSEQAVVDGRAVGDFPNLMHKLHMGDELVKQGYDYNADGGAMQFNTVGFPQDPRNCTKCHNGSAPTDAVQAVQTQDGDNWKAVPNRLACGACHDGIDFATGQGTTLADKAAGLGAASGHGGGIAGAQANDGSCSACHTAQAIPVYHRTEVPTGNNPVVKTGVATIKYEIKSVTVASGKPSITFRILKDGAAITSFAVPTLTANATTGALAVPSSYQPITGFTGGPSFYVAYAVPQDGITAPADFNAYQSASLANLLVASGSPKAGTITGPDSNGYFVATLTGDTVGQPVSATCKQNTGSSAITGNCVNPSPIAIPSSAKLVTGAMMGNFTQRDLAAYPNGLVIKSMLAKLAANSSDARRVAVSVAKCNSCHEQLGTKSEFHGGARNDPTACAICHNPNRASSGWSANAGTFVHGIHAGISSAGGKRSVAFTWAAASATDNFSTIRYPGVLRDCAQCHVDNAVNFGSVDAAKLLWTTVAAGTKPTTNTFRISPYAWGGTLAADGSTAATNYGNGFSFVPAGAIVSSRTQSNGTVVAAHVAAAGGETVAADSATLVLSPVSAACFSCHDTALTKTHMVSNGGAVNEARSTALTKSEQCLLCHGQGKVIDAAVVHHK